MRDPPWLFCTFWALLFLVIYRASYCQEVATFTHLFRFLNPWRHHPSKPNFPKTHRSLIVATAQRPGMSHPTELSALYGGDDPIARPSDLPLAGRHILITAPRAYASALSARLVAAGARPLWVPGVTTCRLQPDGPQSRELDAAVQDLVARKYSHIAFTSRAGVEAILERLATLQDNSSQAEPPKGAARQEALARGAAVLRASGASVWALGADAQALRASGFTAAQTPAVASTDGLVTALEASGIKGATILCPVPYVAPPLVEPPVVPRFLADLSALGATATRAPAYETSLGTPIGGAAAELDLMKSGGVDAIIFCSAAEAQGLALVAGGVDHLVRILQRGHVILAAHGPTTAAGVEAILGLSAGAITVVPKSSASFASVVEALEETFRQRPL